METINIQPATAARDDIKRIMSGGTISKKYRSKIKIVHDDLNAMLKEAKSLECDDCHAPGIVTGVCKICKEKTNE